MTSLQAYTPPEFKKDAFHCPHCQAYAHQSWHQTYYDLMSVRPRELQGWTFSQCAHCKNIAIWHRNEMVYPNSSTAQPPHPDIPPDIKVDYDEARAIIQRSPRGAAALFRLCIQKLCAHLGESGKNINADIASLVSKGLNPKIQKSLDIVRVVGNEAIHPGTIDLQDKPETAVQLASLINFIVETMIAQPKQIEDLYNKLPETKRQEITKRDKK